MAQYDVHKNPGGSRESIPYVVVVQSRAYDQYLRRVVVPLMKKSVYGTPRFPVLSPTFTIGDVAVVFMPLEIISVPAERLGKPVASLAQHATTIINALDEMLTRAYD